MRVWFPNMFMRLVSLTPKAQPLPQAVFHVAPKMTKTEVKEYLTKVYNVDVVKVNTYILAGKWKRLFGKRKLISYKRRTFKKAFVTFNLPEGVQCPSL